MWFPDRFAAGSTPPAGTPGDPGANRDGHVKGRDELAREVEVPGERTRRPARPVPRAATPTRWCAGRRCRARRCATAGGRSATSSSPASRTRRSSAPRTRRCRSASPRRRQPPSPTRAGRPRGAHRDHAGAGVVVIDARTGRAVSSNREADRIVEAADGPQCRVHNWTGAGDGAAERQEGGTPSPSEPGIRRRLQLRSNSSIHFRSEQIRWTPRAASIFPNGAARKPRGLSSQASDRGFPRGGSRLRRA